MLLSLYTLMGCAPSSSKDVFTPIAPYFLRNVKLVDKEFIIYLNKHNIFKLDIKVCYEITLCLSLWVKHY